MVAELNGFKSKIESYRKLLNKSNSRQISSSTLKGKGRELVLTYFNDIRTLFAPNILKLKSVKLVDEEFQELLRLTNAASLREIYKAKLKSIAKKLNEIEVSIVLHGSSKNIVRSFNVFEGKILETLKKMDPEIALSYEQVLVDLNNDERLSYRGVSHEIREILRIVIDLLAPEDEVSKQAGFKLEKGQDKPTRKQKVRFLLKSRGQNQSKRKTAEDNVAIIEDLKGSYVSSIYSRGSAAAHGPSSKNEAFQLLQYLNSALSELLEIKA